jgi:hypothetical protein
MKNVDHIIIQIENITIIISRTFVSATLIIIYAITPRIAMYQSYFV